MFERHILVPVAIASVSLVAAPLRGDKPHPMDMPQLPDVIAELLDTTPEDIRRNPLQEPDDFVGPIETFAPGGDTCLGMSWEPTIAVDPNNPMIVAVSQFTTIQVSFDGGACFSQVINSGPPPNWCPGGDPSLAFDSQGRLFLTFLGSPPPMPGETCQNSSTPGREVWIDGYQIGGGGTFVQLGGMPVSVSGQAGLGAPNNADKEWLAADANPGSPFADNLYVIWTDLDQTPWRIYVAASSDQGQTWQQANPSPINLADEGPRTWPPHIAVAPNGDVYAAWHSQPTFLDAGFRVPDGVSGQIVLRTSSDGGANFGARSFPYGPGQADMTWNVQHLANGVIPGATFWLQGSSQPWILPDPFVAGRVYVVANDDPDNNVDMGDAADVFIVQSNDSGTSWPNPPARVDSGAAGTFAVMPTAAIDPFSGAIAVTYYDNRALTDADNDGNWELDLLATYSYDGGATWTPEVDVNDGTLDPQQSSSCRFCCNMASGCFGQPITIRIGEYNGVAFGECTTHMVWADNNTCDTGDSNLDTFYDRDPEAGGDLDPPVLACPANVAVGCNDPTDPGATGMATATDDCDLDPSVGFVDEIIPGNCPPGVTIETIRRIWNATDAAGNIDTCEQLISIVDADPPLITVPDPLVLECNEPGGVSIDDPQVQAWLAQAMAMDECSEAELTNSAPDLFPSGCGPGETTQVIFTGTDECGNSDFAVSSVTVTDTTPPDVTCSVSIDSLWPPNHKFVDVGLVFEVADICDPDPQVEITVTSDEDPADELGSGGPIHCPDAMITEDGHVLLRTERAGTGDGRIYVVTVTATDNCGNQNACSALVEVRHHPPQPATDSGQAFDATDCGLAAATGSGLRTAP